MKTITPHRRHIVLARPGFTRTELLAIVAGLVLLATVVLPAWPSARSRSERVICANNVRQIGIALQLWADERADLLPWEVSRVPGSSPSPLAVNAWFHFAMISNELNTPKTLWCPTDIGTPATHFGGGTNGGYLHPNFANRATSYFVSHGSTIRFEPADIISGDRNMGFSFTTGCSLFGNAWSISLNPVPSSNYGWDTNLHSQAGNVLRRDGRVEQFSNKMLREDSVLRQDDQNSFHFLRPR